MGHEGKVNKGIKVNSTIPRWQGRVVGVVCSEVGKRTEFMREEVCLFYSVPVSTAHLINVNMSVLR